MDDFFKEFNNSEEPEKEQNTNAENEYKPVPPVSSGYAPADQKPEPPSPKMDYFNAQRPAAPVAQNNFQPMMPGMQPYTPKKKKNTALIVIIVVGILCFAIAAFGIVAGVVYENVSDSTSQSDSNDKDEEKDDDNGGSVNGNAEAKVEDSEANPEKDEDGNLTAVGVVKKTIDSCVGITVYTNQTDYYNFYNYGNQSSNGKEQASGEGSGVIMAEENGTTYIMTCAHVIEDGSSFKVTLENDKEYDATMVGYDSQTDIGVLAIKATGLKVATFGNSDDVELGQACVAIGCPGGLEFKNSVTQGIVSALAAPVQSSIGYKNECIQVDAPINPGNSGGALFNMQGQVIGINSSKIASTEYEGMGFAVPSSTAVKTANALIKNGYVAGRAQIGIEYNSLAAYNSADSILEALAKKGFKDAQGTMVIQTISDDSDLKSKDVKQYDMIVAVDGETLTSTDVMTSKLADSKPGDTVTLTIARVENNSIKTFEVKCKLIERKQ